MSDQTTYYFVLASRKFLLEENPLQESLKERQKNYADREKEIDFWLVESPAFLEAPEMAAFKQQCPLPAAAVISTDIQVIRWLKLRLEFVATGEFVAPSATISDPLASLVKA
ncbi:MgPME-cyclase complex family protein [Tumidithrix helvetica]|uniref:MgPME-cyclase complex family protein n=1 Tax=Tumidithrix helvetica TaxID=3457545 RepID=UPI003CC5D120